MIISAQVSKYKENPSFMSDTTKSCKVYREEGVMVSTVKEIWNRWHETYKIKMTNILSFWESENQSPSLSYLPMSVLCLEAFFF